jgi:hypothetical protein
VSALREGEAAHEEAEYGGKGFDPEVRVAGRLIGGTEGEEDGVSWRYRVGLVIDCPVAQMG